MHVFVICFCSQRLRALLRIVLPGVKSKEFFILCLHTMFLVSRTLVSIYVAQLDGSIVKSIVDRKLKLFVWLMCKWMAIAVPATYINSMIMYLESKLSIAFRSRLVKHVYEMYMKDETYYRVGNLDSRLSNPDQCLTEDVSLFCTDLAHLYSHLSKPCLDVVLMTTQLILISRNRGGGNAHSGQPLMLATLVIFGTGYVLKLATPPFGKLIAEQARRYGELRAAHSRVITHAEEIAFYGGHIVERNILQQCYDDLIKHINYIYRKKIWFTMLEQFLMRYVWGACGMVMIAIPSVERMSVPTSKALDLFQMTLYNPLHFFPAVVCFPRYSVPSTVTISRSLSLSVPRPVMMILHAFQPTPLMIMYQLVPKILLPHAVYSSPPLMRLSE